VLVPHSLCDLPSANKTIPIELSPCASHILLASPFVLSHWQLSRSILTVNKPTNSTTFSPTKRISSFIRHASIHHVTKNLLHSSIRYQIIMSIPPEQSSALHNHITPDPLPATWRISPEFEMQAASIPDQNRFEYESPAKLISTIKTTIDSGSADEYLLYFYSINHGHLPEIDEEFFWCKMRCTVRFITENSLSALICKILPWGRLYTLTLSFWMHILYKIKTIPSHTRDSIKSLDGT